jgi:hypothetical protein
LFFLGTGCATIIHEAVERDIDENKHLQGKEIRAATAAGKGLPECPDGKILYEDCRVTPCLVTCEDPKEPKR